MPTNKQGTGHARSKVLAGWTSIGALCQPGRGQRLPCVHLQAVEIEQQPQPKKAGDLCAIRDDELRHEGQENSATRELECIGRIAQKDGLL